MVTQNFIIEPTGYKIGISDRDRIAIALAFSLPWGLGEGVFDSTGFHRLFHSL